jgi:hypothetical protein
MKMNVKKITDKKPIFISNSNPEWQSIIDLRLQVQRDFNNNESLSIPTYEKILTWKLHQQKTQIKKIREFSPDSLVKTITHCYCKADHPDNEMKTKIKMNILLSIPWIGIGISSSIMSFHEPHLYGIIDSRTWDVLFHKVKKTFSMNDYIKYLKYVRNLAHQVKCDIQELDYILWKLYEA